MRTFATPTRQRGGTRVPSRGLASRGARVNHAQRDEVRHILHGSRAQGRLSETERIRRACGRAGVAPTPSDCILVSQQPVGERFFFNINCDDFAPGEEARLRAFARTLIGGTSNIYILGLASFDGPPDLNESLSCYRAVQGESVLLSEGITPGRIQSVEATGGIRPAGDPTLRAVAIDLEEVLPNCGPDVTDWMERQFAAATRDPDVLAIRRDLATADALATPHGTSVQEVSEGSSATAVLAQLARMGSAAPPFDPTITSQLAAGAASGSAAASALAAHPIDAGRIARLVLRAALNWKHLVDHGARYDFKAHVLRSPTSPSCPDLDCGSTVTICPGTASGSCYLTDLPGNLFYARMGRFVGWSELTLQLGSQLAQLTGTGAWDAPEDTAAIHLGFALPLPLTAAGLCGPLATSRASLTSRSGCAACPELTSAAIR